MDELAGPRRRTPGPSIPPRLPPNGILPAAPAIGGYWTRSDDVEIDLVGADRQPVARRLHFLGSVKWLEQSAFDNHDLAALQKHGSAITDEPVPLVAVSRNGTSCSGLQAAYGPEELLNAWRRARAEAGVVWARFKCGEAGFECGDAKTCEGSPSRVRIPYPPPLLPRAINTVEGPRHDRHRRTNLEEQGR